MYACINVDVCTCMYTDARMCIYTQTRRFDVCRAWPGSPPAWAADQAPNSQAPDLRVKPRAGCPGCSLELVLSQDAAPALQR